MSRTNDYVSQASGLLARMGVHQLPEGVWAFTDVDTASQAYIHHSSKPAALAAYAAVNPTFAAGRFPGWTLVDMVDKVPCMDAIEHSALAMVCGTPAPTFPSATERGEVFGRTAWSIVETYALEGCFECVRAYGSEGSHYTLRPRGFDWEGGQGPVPEALKAMRKSYRAMTPLQQVMVLTILHLYHQGKDKDFLIGGCPTKVLAADAMSILRGNGPALPTWGRLVSHYAGW